MTKQEFLAQLCNGLSGLPQDEIAERFTFYSEMIDDRVEEGISEAEAIDSIGPVDTIISQIVAESQAAKPVKQKGTVKKRLKAWEIVLLVLGAPIWLSLLIAAFAVVLSLYVSVWSVVISLWAVFGSFVGCALGGIAAGVGFAFSAHRLTGVAMIGAGIVCAGLSVFLFYGCKAATKGMLLLTKNIILRIKNSFTQKEEV